MYHDPETPTDTPVQDLPPDWPAEREDRTRHIDLQQVVERAVVGETDEEPLTALSAGREKLGARTGDWKRAARAVEQTLRQLLAAENARREALKVLETAHLNVERTSQALATPLTSFDHKDEMNNIEPLFNRSEEALDELERATEELAIAQMFCRSAWHAYAGALEQEQQCRSQLGVSGHAA
jgi:hypothetical protein